MFSIPEPENAVRVCLGAVILARRRLVLDLGAFIPGRNLRGRADEPVNATEPYNSAKLAVQV